MSPPGVDRKKKWWGRNKDIITVRTVYIRKYIVLSVLFRYMMILYVHHCKNIESFWSPENFKDTMKINMFLNLEYCPPFAAFIHSLCRFRSQFLKKNHANLRLDVQFSSVDQKSENCFFSRNVSVKRCSLTILSWDLNFK